jgi:hypothetical protein
VKMARSCGYNHWRNWTPATYYCTHSVAPIMFITGTRPVQVSAFVIPYDRDDPTQTMTVKRQDTAAVIMCRMDNGGVMKSLHGALRGHGHYVRIHGNRGLMESCRHGDRSRLRIWREPWEKRKGEPVETVYTPDFPQHHDLAMRAGHGGGDFFTCLHFAEAIRSGRQPDMDVYFGIDSSIVGILAWRSALMGSAPVDVPDLRTESGRRRCAGDRLSPDPTRPASERLPSTAFGEVRPSKKAIEFSRRVWRQQGYMGE